MHITGGAPYGGAFTPYFPGITNWVPMVQAYVAFDDHQFLTYTRAHHTSPISCTAGRRDYVSSVVDTSPVGGGVEVPEVSLGVSWESENWEAEKSEVRTRVSSSVTRSGRATMLRGRCVLSVLSANRK